MKLDNKWLGCRRDARDARDHEFKLTRMRVPEMKSLEAHCPPHMDQGSLGSCTAHGITGVLRHGLISQGHADVKLSRLQLYFDERTMEGTVASDAGAEIRDGIKCAARLGVSHETLWPYRINRFAIKPLPAVYKDALKFKALSYQRVPVSTIALKQAIARGYPVVIGVSLYESFDSSAVAATGMVPMPNLAKEQMIGGHCMYVFAYGERKGYFTVRNSWGSSWGHDGDCFMPEAYLGSPKFGSDYWLIRTEGA